MVPEDAVPVHNLGANPRQTTRILGMVRAGHTMTHILEVGRYHGSWSAADVRRVLADNHVHLPLEPDPRDNPETRAVAMSARQVQVVTGICEGMNNAEIAAAIGMPPETVKTIVSSILRMTGCRDRLAVAVAVLTKRLRPVIEGTE